MEQIAVSGTDPCYDLRPDSRLEGGIDLHRCSDRCRKEPTTIGTRIMTEMNRIGIVSAHRHRAPRNVVDKTQICRHYPATAVDNRQIFLVIPNNPWISRQGVTG